MKNKQSLIVFIFCCASYLGFGQILTFEFFPLAGSEVSANSNFNNSNLSPSTITRGAGLNAVANVERFNATSWALTSIANAVSGNDFMEFTITPNANYQFSVTSITINIQRSSTGPSAVALRNSLDGYSSNLDAIKPITDNTSTQSFNFTFTQNNSTSSVTYRFYMYAEATAGSGGIGDGSGNDIIVNGSVTSTLPTIIVSPTSLTNFTYAEGDGSSAEQNFTIEGTFLTDDIAVTPPTNWEIATTSGGPFQTTPITLAQTGGSVATTTIYTRMISGLLNSNSPFSGNITSTSTGATTKNVAVDGTVIPTLADVVITEIMYNTAGADDEWIEICNVSGITQDISNYNIKVGGSTLYTFPVSTTIADGFCITVSLGSNGDSTYNNGNGTPATGYCPFPPDFGINASINDTDNLLNNATVTITLFASNETTIADEVTYDDGDGGDGNGSSLHVIDATQDNSNTGTNWQEVEYGGSWGMNSLISPCIPMVPEIDIERNTFTSIAIGSPPNIVYNTIFASTQMGNTTAPKTYYIRNEGGVNLSVSSITSSNDTEFPISLNPAPLTLSPLGYIVFEILFSPTGTGTRNSTITIVSNDSDENPYTFSVQGNGECSASTITLSPLNGPEGTIVTVSGGTDFIGATTVEFNGVSASNVTVISDSVLEVEVPIGATTGSLEVNNNIGCSSSNLFTVIDKAISSCEGSGTLPLDMFISEVTDKGTGSHSYIELFNGTGSTILLDTYEIRIHNNGASTATNTIPLSGQGNLLDGGIFVIAFGGTDAGTPEGGYTANLINNASGINEDDHIRLYNGSNWVDLWGDTSGNSFTITTKDYTYRRKNTGIIAPSTTWDENDWEAFTPVDYTDIGLYDFSTGTPPVVATGPTIASSCNMATISVSGTEGNLGGNSLAYQWYSSAPGELGWTAITNGGLYDDATTPALDILNTSLLEGYQYYCQIREDDSSCYTASDAVKLTLPTTTWDGSSWSSPPTIDKIAILEDDYTTAVGANGETSFSACSLIINDGVTLTISDVKNDGVNTYVEVMNDLTVLGTGSIIVQPQAAFVQINNYGLVYANNPDNIQVNKETAPMNQWYEYTYWSSPVKDEIISEGLADSSPNRRFWFDAQNYKDSLKENGNSGNFSSGQDDIDDAAPYDWALASDSDFMQPGVGYASTHNSSIFFGPGDPPYQFVYSFKGLFNNGIIEVPIYRNDSESNDNNWNFIGNPYPSAISADSLLLNNLAINKNVAYKPAKSGFIEGAIFFWSQNTQPSTSNGGNQNKNFSQDDYAIISMTGEIAGGDGVTPSRFIPSGQGFFIAMDDAAIATEITLGSPIKEGIVTFTNSMRMTDITSNNKFFRTSGSNSTKSKKTDNKLWLNLTSDNGVFNQMAVGYVDYATNAYDGMAYDTPRNLSNPLYSSIYTLIEGVDKKFAIQGKNPNSLSFEEVIPIGFDTTIDVSTLYTLSIPQVEGDFLTSNPIYLKDNFMNVFHNLSESDYTFTSEVGEFKDRFEIVFQSEALSDIEAQLNIKNLSIIELKDGRVQFKTNTGLTIQSVKIIDMLGRTLYQLKGSNTTEIYNLDNLSQSAYIAKVELSNGQIVTKKAVKRK